MKKIIMLFLSAAILLSCGNDDEQNVVEPTEKDEYVTLGIKCNTPEVVESPMTRATSDTDLYGVEIDEITDSASFNGWGTSYLTKLYAVGYFDDLSKVSAEIMKGRRYAINIVYVPDGKNKIAKREGDDNEWGSPFFNLGGVSPTFGKYVYGGAAGMNFAMYGAQAQNDYRINCNFGNNVEIYYGGTTLTSTQDEEIDVNLYLQMFRVKVNVENLKRGTVAMTYGFSYNECVQYNNPYIYKATPDNPNFDATIGFGHMPWCPGVPLTPTSPDVPTPNPYTDDFYKSYFDTDGMNFTYIKDDGTTINLFTIESFTRMKQYNITFNIDDYIDETRGQIKANVIKDEEWTEVEVKK